MFEVADFGFAGHQFEASGYALVRFTVEVAVVPGAVARFIAPKGQQPNLLGSIGGADDLHAAVTRRVIHPMGTVPEGLFDLVDQPVGDDKFA